MRRSGVISLVVVCACALLAPAAASADQVVRFSTTVGNIDVRLLSEDAPNAVQNFLSYVNDPTHPYNNTVIQRAVHNFVIQGGGYRFTNSFTSIPPKPPITSDFNSSNPIHNVRGTLAMALSTCPTTTSTCTAGNTDPNSATDQWFFNLADNSSSLDSRKFTVFGRVLNDSSLAVMDAIGNSFIDTTDPSPNLDAASGSGVPLVTQATGLTASNLIYVNSITLLNYPSPTVTISQPANKSEFQQGQVVTPAYACADEGGPGLASCTGAKTVDTSLLGGFQYTVTATDDAGDTATQSISYTVLPNFIAKPPKAHPPLLVRPYHITSRGRVSLGLLCTAKVRCIGKLRLLTRRKHTVVGSTNYSVGPGHTWEQTLRLNKTGRHLLHAGHGTLAVTVDLTPSGEHAHAHKHKLTLHVQ